MDEQNAERAREIRAWKCYSEDDNTRPGFQRFVSADPRFPVAISFPKSLNFFYDFNRAENLHLDCRGSGGAGLLSVIREDLALLSEGKLLAQATMRGSRSLMWYQEREMEQRKNAPAEFRYLLNVRQYTVKSRPRDMAVVGMGAGQFHVPRIVFKSWQGDEGEWVFFTRNPSDVFSEPPRDPVLWTIIRNPDPEFARVFATVLSSFQWLPSNAFQL